MPALSVSRSVVLTSTTSSQITTVPNSGATLVVYNGAANPVFLTFGSSVAVPATGTWTGDLLIVQPSTTQTFANGGGTLAYIASTAGGLLTLSVGEGV
ncbi:MAG: hypothetical protein V4696_08580 [Pseudomonadota bacterium]